MKTAVVLALFAGFSFASNIVSYIGNSKVSQEDADNAAISGVAKQIVADVATSEKVVVRDVTTKNKSYSNEEYSSSQRVQSDLTLKWVKVKALPKENGKFVSKATIDIDAVASNLELRLNELCGEIAELELSAKEALASRLYKKASDDLVNAIPKIFNYNEVLDELVKFVPLKKSLKLNHSFHEIEKELIAKLNTIKIRIQESTAKLDKAAFSFNVAVEDSYGTVSDFPLSVYQKKLKLTSKQTLSDGTVSFEISKFKMSKKGIMLSVVADFPEGLLAKSGLNQGTVFNYGFDDSEKSAVLIDEKKYNMPCNYSNSICMVVKERLKKNGIEIDDTDEKLPKISFLYESNEQSSMTVMSTKIVTYNFSVTLEGDGISFYKQLTGAGKNEAEAFAKAAKNLKILK